jgi:hypothetical protein
MYLFCCIHNDLFIYDNIYKRYCFILITKDICYNYNLSGDGDFRRGFIPRERGWEEMFPPSVRGDPREKKKILHENR